MLLDWDHEPEKPCPYREVRKLGDSIRVFCTLWKRWILPEEGCDPDKCLMRKTFSRLKEENLDV